MAPIAQERSRTQNVIDQSVAAVPGLATLVVTWRFPDDLMPLAEVCLGFVILATLAVLGTYRDRILATRRDRIRNLLIGLTAGAIVCFISYGLMYQANVAQVNYQGQKSLVLVPGSWSESGWRHDYGDCTQHAERQCVHPVSRFAETAAAVGDFMSDNGVPSVSIPRGFAWYSWTVALVLLDCLAALSAVMLFGVMKLRGLDPYSLLRAKNG